MFPRSASLVSGLLLLALLAGHRSASAQWTPNDRWVTNGIVSTFLRSGNTLYIGGEFSFIGPRTGAAAILDPVSGELQRSLEIGGAVHASVPDGSGGWFVGGGFQIVNGVPRKNLVHVLSDGTVTDWNPGMCCGGDVVGIALHGGLVYVVGGFREVGGQARHGIAAIDAVTGAVSSWNPDIHYDVDSEGTEQISLNAIVVRENVVYVAGRRLSSLGGQTRRLAAAIDATSGAPTSWNPDPDGWVEALAVRDDVVFAGGRFHTIGGAARSCIAALDAETGAATAWNPGVDGEVAALAVAGSTLYAGGVFNQVGGFVHPFVAAIDADTGTPTSWNPSPNGGVHALAVHGSDVYLVGEFTSVGGQPRVYVAVVDAGSGSVAPVELNADGTVDVVVVDDTRVFLGGYFRLSGGQWRSGLAALDSQTGETTPWNPTLGRYEGYDFLRVWALAIHDTTLYVAGQFASAGGQPRKGVAAFGVTSALPTPWNPDPAGSVYSMAADGARVYLGGEFNFIGSQSRSSIAAVDPISGLPVANWKPQPPISSKINAMTLRGSELIIAGRFSKIGSQTRRNLASLEAETGRVTSWNPGVNQPVSAMLVRDSIVYIGGAFDSVGGQVRNHIAALGVTTGLPTPWDPNADGEVSALAVDGSVVYAGGTFGSVGGQARDHFAAIDASSGVPRDFDLSPLLLTCTFHEYCRAAYVPAVRALEAFEGTVNIGGVFESVSGRPHYFLSSWTADPATATLLTRFEARSAERGVLLSWAFSGGAPVLDCRIERAPTGEGPWEAIDAIVGTVDGGSVAVDETAESGRTYFYRLSATIEGRVSVFGPIQGAWQARRLSRIVGITPNPARGRVEIEYDVARPGPISLRVLDLQGRTVAILANASQEGGRHRVEWSGGGGTDALRPGLYFVRFDASDAIATRRLIVVR